MEPPRPIPKRLVARRRDPVPFRSVREVFQALRDLGRMPDEQTISGDWWGPDDREDEERIAIRERWVETKRQNQAFRGI